LIYGKIIRAALSTIAFGLLSSCYLVPSGFSASLDVRRDGSFTYRYVGDIAYVLPPTPTEIWDDASAKCNTADGKAEMCSSTQLKQQRDAFEQAQSARRRNIDELADLIGFNPADEQANHEIAADMMTKRGWKSVFYKGGGVFAVIYEIKGNIDRDFVFPHVPQAEIIIPFLTLQPSIRGDVHIGAPALTGGTIRKILHGNMGMASDQDMQYFDRINGQFVLTTDAQIKAHTGKIVKPTRSGTLTKIIWTIEKAVLADRVAENVEAHLLLGSAAP
jgi:hypothetical protein